MPFDTALLAFRWRTLGWEHSAAKYRYQLRVYLLSLFCQGLHPGECCFKIHLKSPPLYGWFIRNGSSVIVSHGTFNVFPFGWGAGAIS